MNGEITLYNITGSDIEIDELGITLDADGGTYDVAYFPQSVLAGATELHQMITNGTVGVVSEWNGANAVLWPADEAHEMLTMGFNAYQAGVHRSAFAGVVDGRFYSVSSVQSPYSVPADTLFAIPLNFMGHSFNRIGCSVTTAVLGGTIRLAIYANGGLVQHGTGVPGSLIVDAGYVSTDTAGLKEITINYRAPMNWYWLCMVSSAAVEVSAITEPGVPRIIGSPQIGGAPVIGYSAAHVSSNPLPSVFPEADPVTTPVPALWLRSVA